MHVIGVALLVAATATGGIGKPHVAKRFLRGHAVADGPAPPGGPIGAGAMPGAGIGACPFGHPGCQGGASCPGAAGGGAGGADGMAGQTGRRFPNVRSQIFFVDPPGMKIGWQTTVGSGERIYLPDQLTVPARYNFMQGYIYRLKLTQIADRPGLVLYPTIEVAPSTPATDAYLTHNPIPAQFTPEDFDQVVAGNFVTKVIYLPDPKYQELAIAGVETLVSTRLEPGVDPILEADRRGTILMIMRVGAIDLEMPNAGSSAPGAASTLQPGTVLRPNSLPPGAVPNAPPTIMEGVPVDNAPVSPAPATPPQPPTPAVEPPAPAVEPEMPAEPAVPAVEPAAPAEEAVPAPAEEPAPPPAADDATEPVPPPAEEPQLRLDF